MIDSPQALGPSPAAGRSAARAAQVLALLVTLLLAGVGVAAEPAGATTSGTVRTWIADHQRSVVDTVSEATTLARRHNFIIARDNYEPFLPAMKTANPKVVVAPYRNAISVPTRVAEQMLISTPHWLLRDASGALLKDQQYGTYLLNPAEPEIWRWHIDAAKAAIAKGYSGIYLDCLGVYGLNNFGGTPINPSTGLAFTEADWLKATADLAAAVKAAVAVPVVGNGMRDGGSYHKTSVLVPAVDMGLFEACFRPATAPLTNYPTPTMWQTQVNALADMVAKGTKPLCMVKTWASGTETEKMRWRDFAVASFLIAAGSVDGFHFTRAETDTALQHTAFSHIAIGTPAAAPTYQSGVALRRFTAGIAVVNPTSNSVTVQLGATYRTASGAYVTRITVAPKSAQLLTK